MCIASNKPHAPVVTLRTLELLAGQVDAQVALEVRQAREAFAADVTREHLARLHVHHLDVRLQDVAIL